jgi:hypothetical protein
MKTLYQYFLLTLGALAIVGTAPAQVPAGTWTGNDTSDSSGNTGMGTGALGDAASAGGSWNTASGYFALHSNTTGGTGNTASGYNALFSNTTGGYNTASGLNALLNNTTGADNTASGSLALYNNSTGNYNTASGYDALYSNTSGRSNSALGVDALYSNTGGNYNNASGYFALHDNTNGSQNSASGVQALFGNKTGNYNTASGTDALYSNTSGSTNIAEGYKAGYNLTTGSDNIDIGNQGVAVESGTIRIGTTATQTSAYIAGIYGTSVTGNAVVVSSTGQLGVTVSSERFKTDIVPMGSNSQRLQQLRPVTFHLKADPHGVLQYGLIAEDVAKVYPELVIRDGSGRIDGVRYDELAPILIHEVQEQRQRIAAQDAQIGALKEAQLRDRRQQFSEITSLRKELYAALVKLAPKEEALAQH